MNIWLKTSAALAFLWLLILAPSSVPVAFGQSESTVFGWRDVPQNQEVPITHATFDRGGYQLYDTAGETIVVPYRQHSMWVLQFALSDNGDTYMVNDGDAPVLYMPADGDLENASVPGARWYPFHHGYRPSHPVYMCIAPSITLYDNMGWYDGMNCYGGYEGNSYSYGGTGLAIDIGLVFLIGGHYYNGWAPYHSYYYQHPDYHHVGYYNRNVYTWAARPSARRSFVGTNHQWARNPGSSTAVRGRTGRTGGHAASSARQFRGTTGANHGTMARTVAHGTGARTARTSSHSFRGANQANHGTMGRTVTHGTGARTARTSSHSFRGATGQSNGNYSRRSTSNGAYRNGSTGSSFRGGNQSTNNRRQSFGGGARQSSGGNTHRSFGGSTRQSSGGDGQRQSRGGGGGRNQSHGGGGHQSGGNNRDKDKH